MLLKLLFKKLIIYLFSEEVTVNSSSRYRLPSNSTMQHAAKFAITNDKPIMLDYWADSLDKEVIIGQYDNGEKIL